MDANMPRWIFASISKHFFDRRNGVDFYIEGQHRDAKINKELIELRIDGPYVTEMSKDVYKYYTEVSVLIQTLKNDKDYHRIHTLTGMIAAAMTDINVYKFGKGLQDDATQFVGCLQLVQDVPSRERVQINNFGQIETSTPLMQASVEAHYKLII